MTHTQTHTHTHKLQVREMANGIDLFLRDRFRKAAAAVPSLLAPPRLLPFLPPPPAPPTPPVFLPGLGLVSQCMS